jgi:hypothetical protein
MLPSTARRVPEHTPRLINQRIRRRTEERLAQTVAAGPHAINQRLEELDREWDIERALEANAASISLIGLGLGAFVDRRFFALPALVAGFLLQHALQGWCPPLPVLRRRGYRTQTEIEQERYALKLLRGDFREVASPDTNIPAEHADILAAIRR